MNNLPDNSNKNISLNSTYLFEISWEVCNKVGGIYTVITSKLNEIQKHIKSSNYYCIGPYFNQNNSEFEPIKTPELFESIINELNLIGIKLHFGTWKIKNNTNVILIEYMDLSKDINNIKSKIWELYKIDSLNSSWYDWDEPILWSWSCGIVIEKLNSILNRDNILVHAHEWMSGGTILYLNSLNDKEKNKYKTIFTTHATMLGRSLSANKFKLNELENKINPDQKAYELNIYSKHQTEKVLANISTCFTTVSDITAKEATLFYNKKPDVLLYNGFDDSQIPNFDDLNVDYLKSRLKINLFLKKYFHNFYDINLDNSQIYYTSGRFEFENKGIDLLCDSAKLLNEKLIKENSNKNIILFLLISMGDFEKNSQIVDSINNFNSNKKRDFELSFAPITTHQISNDNLIIQKLIQLNLLNKINDKVKIILIPEMLNGNENTFNLEYYSLIKGTDLGIFASYYEPWGYTPLESISYAIPTITSDLSGFGLYSKENIKIENEDENPIKIVPRINNNYNDSKERLYQLMYNFTNKNQKQLEIQREYAKKTSSLFEWKLFIKNYLNVYNLALKK